MGNKEKLAEDSFTYGTLNFETPKVRLPRWYLNRRGRRFDSMTGHPVAWCLMRLNDFRRELLYGLVVGEKHLAMKMLQETGGVELVHHRAFDLREVQGDARVFQATGNGL